MTPYQSRQFKREQLQHPLPPPAPPQSQKDSDDNMPATSDFVKKLYKILEDQSFPHTVSCGPNGGCFVVKLNKYDWHKVKNTDGTQFGEHSWTFRHPDFHADRREALENMKRKVPAARVSAPSRSAIGPSTLGLQNAVSGFQNGMSGLQPQVAALQSEDRVRGLERYYKDVLGEMVRFQRNLAQQDGLMQSLVQYFLRAEGGKLEEGSWVVGAMDPCTLPRVHCACVSDAPKHKDSVCATSIAPGPAPPTAGLANNSQQIQKPHTSHMVGSHGHGHGPPTTSTSSSTLFRALSRSQAQAQSQSPSPSAQGLAEPPIQSIQSILSMQEQISSMRETIPLSQTIPSGTDMTSGDAPFLIPPDTSWDGTVQTVHEGLQVFTLGNLLPRSALDDANGNWTYGGDIPGTPNMNGGGNGGGNGCADEDESSSATSGAATPSSGGGQKLRVRRSTFVPGWAVPPRVLLVDDDAVSRRLSSKFLQVFRCAVDVAVDVVGAVNKMNLEKYDLVLMDIVMPEMDGISATSLIRQFDHVTPIILMTSNSRPSERKGWGLRSYDLVQKHLMHLKVIQEMSRVPRIPCAPRLSTDNSLTDALVPASATPSAATTSTSSASSSGTTVAYSGGDGGGIGPPSASANAEGVDGNGNGPLFIGGVGTDIRIDPLAGMGLTEERYQAILKDLVNGDNLGVPEGFSFDMIEDEGIVDVGVGLSEGMSVGMGMGEKRGLEEEQDGIREVKREPV
ncbi:hypothetical protein BKA82DRAFT_4331113 [Pisolithus tinctorius]|nr:hypothetical protein BKA82DRAFT_4331113 [Pisolithus tinctorius]